MAERCPKCNKNNYLYLNLQKSIPEKSVLPKNFKKYPSSVHKKGKIVVYISFFNHLGTPDPPFFGLFRFKVNFLIWTWCTRNVIKITIRGRMHETICGTLANSCCRNWTYGTLAQIMQCTEQSPLRFAILNPTCVHVRA